MFERLKAVLQSVPVISAPIKSQERLAFEKMVESGEVSEFVSMLDDGEIKMIRKDSWTWVSENGVIHVYNDIYGPEIKLGNVDALVDCNPDAYGLKHEDGERVYDAIWAACDRSRKMV